MKLLITADLHGTPLDPHLGQRARATGCAMIVIAGDLLDCFGSDLAAQSWAAAAWLRELTDTAGQVAVCSGNHDPDGPEGAGWLLRAAAGLPAGTLTVDGGHAVCGDLVVSVVPYWNRYEGGEAHHQRLRARAEEVWREGRQLADRHRFPWAVVHHEPPEGLAVAAGEHAPLGAGSAWCAGWILDYRPDYVCSGHLHRAPFARRGSWAARIPETGTWAFNPGRRETGGALVELDTAARKAKWFHTWTTESSLTLDLEANPAGPKARA